MRPDVLVSESPWVNYANAGCWHGPVYRTRDVSLEEVAAAIEGIISACCDAVALAGGNALVGVEIWVEIRDGGVYRVEAWGSAATLRIANWAPAESLERMEFFA